MMTLVADNMPSVFALLQQKVDSVGDNQNAEIAVPAKYIQMMLTQIATLKAQIDLLEQIDKISDKLIPPKDTRNP